MQRNSTKKSSKPSSAKESSKTEELKSSPSQEKGVKAPATKKQKKKPEVQQPPSEHKAEDEESFGLPESETVCYFNVFLKIKDSFADDDHIFKPQTETDSDLEK